MGDLQAGSRLSPRASSNQSGTVALLGAVAAATLIFVLVAALNLVLDQYAKGVFHTAADEAVQVGSQQGAPGGAVAACLQRAASVRRSLLPGPLGDGLTVACNISGGNLVATATGVLPSWLPLVPDVAVHLTAESHLEQAPTPTS